MVFLDFSELEIIPQSYRAIFREAKVVAVYFARRQANGVANALARSAHLNPYNPRKVKNTTKQLGWTVS
ncbi:conserved hypothetical protein [Ricinus communis]|uniref:Uncharacterized protein n=1 Tax=Ricinus communis TaxID=3988 RepID=B9SEE7_RICCO|nr:conserved hypothetical protein [Ricinus communis]